MTLRDGGDGLGGGFFRRWRLRGNEEFVRELEAGEENLRWFIAGFIHDRDEADDIFAETVATAYIRRYKFMAGGGSFRAWIEQIAYNKVREHFRSRRRAREDALSDTSQVHQETLDQEEALVVQEDAASLGLSLGDMDAGQQMVLRLHYLGRMSVSDIAGELNLSEDAVKKRLSRGRQRLGDLLRAADVYWRLSAEGKRALADLLSEDPELRGKPDADGDTKPDM